VLAVLITLALARGVQQTLRLLLAGVIVGVVFGAFAALVMFLVPTCCAPCRPSCSAPPAFLGWGSVALLGMVSRWSCSLAVGLQSGARRAGAGRSHGGQPGHAAGRCASRWSW
jgi:iron complex transport system permease protein